MEYNAKENLYSFVSCYREELKLIKYPISTIDFCNNDETTKLIYRKFNTPGLCGIALPGRKVDTIILNANRSEYEQNFDCGHELIHLLKHRNTQCESFMCMNNNQNAFIEWEANEGSAELLLPYTELLPIIEKNKYKLTTYQQIHDFKVSLSNKFHVPIAVTENRIENLKYETFQYLNGTPLSDIEILSNSQQRKRNITVKSLNDIENDLFFGKEFTKWRQRKFCS